jgi:glucosyl-3-phosphoglycerate synthase
MEFVQERVATYHDFGDARPTAPTERVAVVVPMTGAEHASLAAERVLSTLARVDPAHVYVALRADPERVALVRTWVAGFDLDATVLWCNAPGLEDRLAAAGLDGPAGKGRDVWLALGVAGDADYVAVHDADAITYDATVVPKLVAPLAGDAAFVKGYYARVEGGRLYGRLFRLFVRPLLDAVASTARAPIVEYLLAFRYALAGEFATTGTLARSLRAQPGWGLEIGTLGEAFGTVGFEGSAQVDLGVHRHDHRGVGGPTGLGDMAVEVGGALLRVLAENGVDLDVEALPERYREAGYDAVDRYAADAAFNGLEYDRDGEREQVETYADAIRPLGEDRRLPPWSETSLSASEVVDLALAEP